MQSEFDRIREAYITMASRVNYRPAAPNDGMGTIELSTKELNDEKRLSREASDYAKRFMAEENTRSFVIGVSQYGFNRALVYTIEAARLLCAGESALAFKLLEMAAEEARPEVSARAGN